MFWPVFDPMYYLFAIPALILGLYAQYKVQSSYAKYQRVANRGNIPGYQAAQRLLAYNSLGNVSLREAPGQLSDHYDPRSKTLALSAGVARSASVASLGIVAHEVGHAVQDAQAYGPLKLRAGLVPVVQIGSWLGPIIFIAGMLLPIPNLSLVGLLLFSGTLIFSLVTLPVEYDASRRAVAMLKRTGLVSPMEEKGVQEVLSAATLTYVAAAAQSVSTLLYYIFILGGGRRRD
ncbi:MAG: zinc metallopeptidase [Chloroflexi bacterium]|nr:zinc metallopeptidase [Chloroflexota bacterium]